MTSALNEGVDTRLYAHFERELQSLRDQGADFARAYPHVAGQLGLSASEAADPDVERLMEGFAYLAARIQLRQTSEFSQFTEQLLQMVYPEALAPTPSMAVISFRPDPKQQNLAKGYRIKRETRVNASVAGQPSDYCVFRTAHEVTLWPIELTGIRHTAYTGDLGSFPETSSRPVRSTLRLQLRSTNGAPLGDLQLNRLPLFLSGPRRTSTRLYELLCGHCVGILLKTPTTSTATYCRGATAKARGFDDCDALLPAVLPAFRSFRFLQEYFALPERFLFVDLCDLDPEFQQITTQEVEVVVLLSEPEGQDTIGSEDISLFATPVINLFEKRCDRIRLDHLHRDFRVVPDSARPGDFEVHSLRSVRGFGSEQPRTFEPFFTCKNHSNRANDGCYYTVRREPRRRQNQGTAAGYVSSEAFVSLVDSDGGPFKSDLAQVGTLALCSNRDHAMSLPLDQLFHLDDSAPLFNGPGGGVRLLIKASHPKAALGLDQNAWRVISHLSLNYLPLSDAPETLAGHKSESGAALRELLQLYAPASGADAQHWDSDWAQKQITGVVSLTAEQVVRRLPLSGRPAFGRGLKLTLTCDELHFQGSAAFVLGSVLEQVFARYISLNSFIETVLVSKSRGPLPLMHWAPRIGGNRPA